VSNVVQLVEIPMDLRREANKRFKLSLERETQKVFFQCGRMKIEMGQLFAIIYDARRTRELFFALEHHMTIETM
jgi:hypothetical protein